MSSDNEEISLEGRKFRAHQAGPGVVDEQTLFEYHQEGSLVWARYAGGHIQLGFLVGTRDQDELSFRYSQLHTDGETANGHCSSHLHLLDDGRLHLIEMWTWESRPGSGRSYAEEVVE